MNKLQKDFKKTLKRRHRQKVRRSDPFRKTGRAKVQKRIQEEYRKRIRKQETPLSTSVSTNESVEENSTDVAIR